MLGDGGLILIQGDVSCGFDVNCCVGTRMVLVGKWVE